MIMDKKLQEMMNKTSRDEVFYCEQLQDMMDKHAYDELTEKVKEQVGEKNFDTIFPAIAKALVDGGREEREQILITWLGMDSCRVCSTCGKIMSEGWYLNDAGYACSDECAAKSEGISMEEFEKYQIYKDDIQNFLDNNEHDAKYWGRRLEDLTKEECAEIINKNIMENVDYYWTEWY